MDPRRPLPSSRARHGLRACLLLVLCVLPWTARAQHFSFRQYTQPDGLTNLAVRHLASAPGGDLWIGTESGLFRFDGVAFTAYDRRHGLSKENVRGLAVSPQGEVWTWLDSGLFRGGEAGFEAVATAAGPLKPDPVSRPIFLGPDRVLLTVNRQLVDLRRGGTDPRGPWTARPLFSPAALRARPELGDVRTAMAAPDGSVWLGCGERLCRLSTAGVEVFGPEQGVPPSGWKALLVDHEGRLWARSATRLVVRDPAAGGFSPRDPPRVELKAELLTTLLAMDGRGRVLTRTTAGLARWDGRGWTGFNVDNGLPSTAVMGVNVDADGDLWLGVHGQGLWRWIGYDHLESWGRREGLSDESVWSIARDAEGRLVLGTDHGCEWLVEAERRAQACPYRGLPAEQALTLTRDPAGDLWLGMGRGTLWTVPRDRFDARSIGLADPEGKVAQIAFDDPRQGWVSASGSGSGSGLMALDRATGKLSPPVPLEGHKGRVWQSIALRGGLPGERCVAASTGLYHVTDGRGRRVPLPANANSAGVGAGIHTLAQQADGTTWAASTGQGLLRLDGCGAGNARWVEDDVVAKAHTYTLRIDGRGWVWAGTDQGVAVFDGQAWQRLDMGDGLVWNDTNEDAIFADVDGSMWIGTATGMTHVVDPEGLFARRRKPLDLRISSVSLGDRRLHGGERLPWEAAASLDLRLASHSHGRSINTRFEYRLIGLSPKWLASRVPEVHLPALEPGAYRLELRADDPDHAQRSPTLAMDFEVLPPWWRSLPFRACVIAVALGLLAFAWRTHVGRLHARRRAMEAQYREREALMHRATRDALTGLWNRPAILEILAREIAQADRTGEPCAVAVLDVDHFKRINDTYGHLGGDDVLRELGARVDEALRKTDWIGRYGGEELLVVMPGLPRDEMQVPVERLRLCVADRPFDAQGQRIAVTMSLGVAWSRPGLDRVEDLIGRADAALYEAKRTGRNRAVRAADPEPQEEHAGA